MKVFHGLILKIIHCFQITDRKAINSPDFNTVGKGYLLKYSENIKRRIFKLYASINQLKIKLGFFEFLREDYKL